MEEGSEDYEGSKNATAVTAVVALAATFGKNKGTFGMKGLN